MNDIFNPQVLTMTSREIAELVEVRHDNVKRTVERCVETDTIIQPPTEDEQSVDTMGRPRITQVYILDKRSSLIVVAQLSPAFTAKLVDRWQELEEQAMQLATPATPTQLEQRVPTPIEVEENTAALKRMAADEEFKAQFPLIYQSVLDGAQNTMLAFVGMAPLLIGGAAKPKDVAEIAKAAKLSIPANLKSSAGKFVKQRYKGEPSIVERIINGSIREAHAYTDHAQVEGLIKLYLESKT